MNRTNLWVWRVPSFSWAAFSCHHCFLRHHILRRRKSRLHHHRHLEYHRNPLRDVFRGMSKKVADRERTYIVVISQNLNEHINKTLISYA
jgi:hypothetical protein